MIRQTQSKLLGSQAMFSPFLISANFRQSSSFSLYFFLFGIFLCFQSLSLSFLFYVRRKKRTVPTSVFKPEISIISWQSRTFHDFAMVTISVGNSCTLTVVQVVLPLRRREGRPVHHEGYRRLHMFYHQNHSVSKADAVSHSLPV